MPATIYSIIKEFYAEIHGHPVKARIISPIQDENTFTFQVSSYFKKNSDSEANVPASTFTSYANAERHLFGYLEAFQNTIDLGGDVAPGVNF
ncbi:hypothetical protein [Pedobacter rhizosphaerae]|uniref:Uncharacterized protein n=1 Tax=Pedobacter rhizosphaerae TaxID=390241 RepID=A0A1H9Q9A6_9SPHI|nr:hypothetical protein [Pedobacter rhizosphaerae]SER57034.1 hypothetical protein SAMN04488023_11188 [Pedobacter rhizosphaerae]